MASHIVTAAKVMGTPTLITSWRTFDKPAVKKGG